MTRSLDPGERMTDRFDQAYTLNFATVVTVRGELDEARLQHALRCLERRHPLLRARLLRTAEDISFQPGVGAPIPLLVEDAPLAQLGERAAATIDPCVWADDGPRAELVWLRHGARHASLLLRLHHVVSDGSSGVLAMRDLLSYLQPTELAAVVPLPSPGQESFFPSSHAHTRAQFLAAAQTSGGAPSPPSEPILRLARFERPALSERRARLLEIRLDEEDSARLASRARRDGATVHGVLNAAVALSVADEHGAPARQRLSHPVDLRRYLRERDPGAAAMSDLVGYYVSGITTEHSVAPKQPLAALAREISAAVRAGKASGEPLTSAPLRGPFLVEKTRAMPLDAFRLLAEQKLFTNTFGITNLGPLEKLGAAPQVGELQVEDFYFVAASSVMGQLGGSAVSFAGRIALHLNAVEPLVAPEVLQRVADRTRAALLAYARGADAA